MVYTNPATSSPTFDMRQVERTIEKMVATFQQL